MLQVIHWPLGAPSKSKSISIDPYMSNFAAEKQNKTTYLQLGSKKYLQFSLWFRLADQSLFDSIMIWLNIYIKFNIL